MAAKLLFYKRVYQTANWLTVWRLDKSTALFAWVMTFNLTIYDEYPIQSLFQKDEWSQGAIMKSQVSHQLSCQMVCWLIGSESRISDSLALDHQWL